METALKKFNESASNLYSLAIDAHNDKIKNNPEPKEISFRYNLDGLTKRLEQIKNQVAFTEYMGQNKTEVYNILGKEAEKFVQRFISEAEVR